MARTRLALAMTLGYALAFYIGASVAFVLPFGSAAYSAVSAGAQALCVLFGLDY